MLNCLEKYDKYPLITDSNDNVLSMPPIINGELTKLSEKTVNILIDVTGTDERAVNSALNIIACSFAETGGKIKTMKIVYPDRVVETPDLTPKKMNVSVDNAQKIIGVELSADDVVKMLRRARLGADYDTEENVIVSSTCI